MPGRLDTTHSFLSAVWCWNFDFRFEAMILGVFPARHLLRRADLGHPLTKFVTLFETHGTKSVSRTHLF